LFVIPDFLIGKGMFIIINLIFLIAVVICGVIDYKQYIIPNVITIPLIIIGLAIQVYYYNWINIIFALVISFVVLILASLTGGMGGGDIKLILALFLWFQPVECLNIVIVSSVIGIIWGIAKKLKAVGYQDTKNEYTQKIIMLKAIGINGIENQGALKKHEIVPFGTCITIGVAFYYIFIFFTNI